MSLDVLVEVLTKEKEDGVPKEVTIEGKPAELVIGFMYIRNISSNGSISQIKTVDIVYQRLDNKKLYRANVPFDEAKKSQIHSPSEDLRYLLFGSRKRYKAFLDLLNRENLHDEELFTIFQKINSLFGEMYNWLGNACPTAIRKILKDYRNDLKRDPIISPYIERAKSYLKK